ncbi:MAG: tyrosine-type recombinase/integrase [Clostridia bacterium]
MARSKGEGSIYYIEKRKKWSAQYTITVGGKQVRKTVYGNTKREVADKLLDLRVQMKDIDLIKEHGMSIIQIMKDIRDKKFNSNRIKEGQYTRITKTIEKIENSSLGKLNVKDISNDDIQKFLNDNKNYSNSYIKKLYEQLNQAFNFAMKNKYILQNPMDDVIKPKSTKEDKEVRALTIEEQQSLSNYLLNCTINEETYKNVFLIQMYLGLRIGETLALNINDIDIEKQIINVNKTLTLGKDNEVIMGDTTKTYASKRTVPIPDFLIPSIKEQLDVAKENKDNMLFLYNDHYISHSVANSRLKRILKSTLGMEVKDISTHSLRHTFATRCIEAGMSAVVLQRLIGHTDISITLNTYTSVFNRFKESELEKVMEYYKTNSLGLEPIKNEEIVENKEVEIEDDMEM